MYLCLPLLLPFLRMCVELHCGHWIAKPLYPSFYYATPLGMVLAPSFGIGIVFYTFWTMCYTLFIVTTISLRQIVTPDRLQSRVNASARLIAWGGQPFGAAVGGSSSRGDDGSYCLSGGGDGCSRERSRRLVFIAASG